MAELADALDSGSVISVKTLFYYQILIRSALKIS